MLSRVCVALRVTRNIGAGFPRRYTATAPHSATAASSSSSIPKQPQSTIGGGANTARKQRAAPLRVSVLRDEPVRKSKAAANNSAQERRNATITIQLPANWPAIRDKLSEWTNAVRKNHFLMAMIGATVAAFGMVSLGTLFVFLIYEVPFLGIVLGMSVAIFLLMCM